MKQLLKSISIRLAALLFAFAPVVTSVAPVPVLAADKKPQCTETAILHDAECDNGSGSSILGVLQIAIDIITVLIGILGAIGIAVVGIQYLTAGGSEEKTRKAKRRLFEIVIGLAAYVTIYALLRFLLPSAPSDWGASTQ